MSSIMSSIDVGAQTVLGCPISSILSLESACSVTNLPACATATSAKYDAACCGSLTTYGLSLLSCYEKHAPTCLDTSAVVASVTGGVSGTNPCAAYATPGSGGGSSTAPTTSAAVLTSAGSSAAAGTGSAASTAASAGSTGSPAGSSTSASATAKSNAPRVGAGLKVYIGVALVGALAVLAM